MTICNRLSRVAMGLMLACLWLVPCTALAADPSEATQDCIACHEMVTP